MEFPLHLFDLSDVEFELVHDTRVPDERLFRYRNRGAKEPYFQFSFSTDLLPRPVGLALGAELDAYQGALELFDLPNPVPAIKNLSGVTLFGSAQKGDTQITLSTGQESVSEIVSAGDFIQIEGSKKAYSLRMGTYNSNAGGGVTVTLSQPLIQDYPSGSSINYGDDVVFQVCLSDRDSTSISGSDGNFITFDVDVIEQL